MCVCVFFLYMCVVRAQSGLIFFSPSPLEVIQLLQLSRQNCRLKHANHFNLKPIPSHLTPMYYTDVEPFSLLPFIRCSSAAHGERRAGVGGGGPRTPFFPCNKYDEYVPLKMKDVSFSWSGKGSFRKHLAAGKTDFRFPKR